MRVRLRTLMAGPAGIIPAGGIADLPKAQAYDLIERGFAEQVEETAAAAAPQAAALAPQERAAKPPPRRRQPAG